MFIKLRIWIAVARLWWAMGRPRTVHVFIGKSS